MNVRLQVLHVVAVFFFRRDQVPHEFLVGLAGILQRLRVEAVAVLEVPVAVLGFLQSCHLALVALELLRVQGDAGSRSGGRVGRSRCTGRGSPSRGRGSRTRSAGEGEGEVLRAEPVVVQRERPLGRRVVKLLICRSLRPAAGLRFVLDLAALAAVVAVSGAARDSLGRRRVRVKISGSLRGRASCGLRVKTSGRLRGRTFGELDVGGRGVEAVEEGVEDAEVQASG